MLSESQIREIQVGLRMVKQCESCDEWKPVYAFDWYGISVCRVCLNERWWYVKKTEAAVA